MFNPQPKPTPKPKKKPKHVRFRSEKRSKQEDEYKVLRKQHLEKNPRCVVCDGPADQIHHSKGRTGKLLTDTRYFKSVDTLCHQEIEQNPEWAKENNYSIDRL